MKEGEEEEEKKELEQEQEGKKEVVETLLCIFLVFSWQKHGLGQKQISERASW